MTPLKTLIPLSILCAVLIGHSYIDSAWTDPAAGSIASTNTPAPVSVGTNPQTKTGALGLNSLVVFGAADVDGRLRASTSVWSRQYCDQNGANCTTSVGGGGGSSVSLTAGSGVTLSPTTITGTGTISINQTYTQQRVTGTCPAGQAIRTVNADGTVTCQAATTTCLWRGVSYSSGYQCRMGASPCSTSTRYHYRYCTNGVWSTGSFCSLSTPSAPSCPV